MVRLSDLIDLDAGRTTRKSLSEKRHQGVEAPRNRSEQPAEASCSFCIGGDDILCTCHMTNVWPEKNCYVNEEAPMKKLISEELAKRPNTGQNAPSIVARLMGLDTLPVDTRERNPPKEERLRNVSSGQKVFDSFDRRSSKSREHPQEEELQKFKKEFEAYQTARFKECSKFVELGTNTDQWLAHRQHLNEEKFVPYANSMRTMVTERSVELKGLAVTQDIHERGTSKVQKDKNEFLAAARNKTNRALNIKSGSAPTKIVILRPAFDRTRNNEESWASSPSRSEDGSSIEEFLQEVKERIKFELQHKSFRKTIEKPSDAKRIAQCIAKQVRESVTRDVETILPRSESMQSYRSEIQRDHDAGPPEFTNRDTRRFLTERLRNVPMDESSHDIDKHGCGSSRSEIQNRENSTTEEIIHASNKMSHGDEMKNESDTQSRYLRPELGTDVMLDQKLFHRNLVRSLSAPVSRSSFGKLLLEDQHVLTGAHIRRKHEAIEGVTVNVKKWRKEKFNLKEKVSSFKYSFVLRGRLFGRKIQSLEESHGDEQIHTTDLQSTQTVASKFYVRQENSTEVPPSPASVCSTTKEEFWRQTDYFSPSSSSISDVNPLDDSEIPHVFKEISSNLNELRRQLNQLETHDSEETIMIEDHPIVEEIIEIDDPAEAFIRDLLVASGLYDGSCEKYLSKWDPLGKPISNQVFEEVEESYRLKINDNEEGSSSTDHQCHKLNHKLLCDLLNEVLPRVLGSTSTKRSIGPTPRAPRGKKLLECVWEIARVSSDMSSRSLENILARDLQCTCWDRLVDEDVNALGKDVEYHIVGDLIHEMINEMQP
ncbi:uncharacterized protein LOC107868243 isoform X1 [Capsicum annuum]|uniref:uncharacterized protein LOC107868243 isoform X1 n=2 Tax=Capsicum annuum TaxID=4072 RepID=UPI001FB14198|nr:uncharacterized protein LOC107868243 isoform X1 [Capsicum annuum]XP_016570362.2 uncharacterized protein LOC107868243 isoform X1 [Capsicum annuum]